MADEGLHTDPKQATAFRISRVHLVRLVAQALEQGEVHGHQRDRLMAAAMTIPFVAYGCYARGVFQCPLDYAFNGKPINAVGGFRIEFDTLMRHRFGETAGLVVVND